MSFSFLLDDGLEYTTPSTTSSTYVYLDKGLSRQVTNRTLKAQFGDGYQQRIADGINTQGERINAKVSNRPKVEIDAIAKTLENKKGVTAITLRVPDEQAAGNTKNIKVICANYQIIYAHDSAYTLSLNLQRVYE